MEESIDLKAIELWAKFYRNFNLLVQISREELSTIGISGPQYGVLRILQLRGDRTMGEISGELLVTAGNVTGLVDRLVQEGWVRRRSHVRDKRVVRIGLTEAGRELVKQASETHHRLLTKIFSVYSEEDKKALAVLLDRLESTLSREKTPQVVDSAKDSQEIADRLRPPA